MTGHQKITIDGATLRRCGSDLARVADGLADTSARIAGSSIASDAFGIMNSWMVDPIRTVSDRSTELVSTSGAVTSAVGKAAGSAADDFDELEQAIVTTVSAFLSQLDNS
jgi:hypothetical protein